MRLLGGLIDAWSTVWSVPLALTVFVLSHGVCLGQEVGAARSFRVEAERKPFATDTGDWHVFLVSVKDYDENIRGLRYTDEDVQALYDRFMNLNVPPENITILSKSRPSNTYYPAKKQIRTVGRNDWRCGNFTKL